MKKPQPRKYKDEMGNVYGYLTVINQAPNILRLDEKGNIEKVESAWECKCICGKVVVIRGRELRANIHNMKSCGCRGFKEGEVAFNDLYCRMKNSAESRNYQWNLSREFVKNITSKSCTYCGISPNQVSKSRSGKGDYIYNGIDRVDNTKGYTEWNVVPCCKRCNGAKLTMSINEFREFIEKIYNHWISLS